MRTCTPLQFVSRSPTLYTCGGARGNALGVCTELIALTWFGVIVLLLGFAQRASAEEGNFHGSDVRSGLLDFLQQVEAEQPKTIRADPSRSNSKPS
jgi:hypothetical protein